MDLKYSENQLVFQAEVRRFLAENLSDTIAKVVHKVHGLTKDMIDELHSILSKRLACRVVT